MQSGLNSPRRGLTRVSGASSRRCQVSVRSFALLLACAYFTTQTDRFLTGPNLSLVVQQSMVVGVLAIGQTLDHPHRRHRSFMRRRHGVGVDRNDPTGGGQWAQSLPRDPARNRRMRRIRRAQRWFNHQGATPAIHRDSGNAEYRLRHYAHLFPESDGHECPRCDDDFSATLSRSGKPRSPTEQC